MPESLNTTLKASPVKETLQDRAKAWVVDQATKCVVQLGRSPVEVVAESINVPLNALLAVIQSTDRLTVIDGDLDLSICSDSVARSLDRWCNDVLKSVGSAVALDDLADLITVHLGKSSDAIISSIRASSAGSRSGVTVVNDQIILNDWLPMLAHDDLEDILLENGVKAELLAALTSKIGNQSSADVHDFSVRLLEIVQNKPIRHKTLAVVYWSCTKRKNPAEDLVRLMSDERLLWHSGSKGGRWVLSKTEHEYRGLLNDLVPKPGEPVPADIPLVIEHSSAVTELLPSVVIDADVIAKIQSDLFATGHYVDLLDYGIPSEQIQDYAVIVDNMDGISCVGNFLYQTTETIPVVDIQSIVDTFSIPKVEFISEDGEQVEDLISPDSYIGTLKSDVTNPNNQDVLDDAIAYTGDEDAETWSFPLFIEHIQSGIIPLCRLSGTLVPWNVEYSPVRVLLEDQTIACTLINRNGVRCLIGLDSVLKAHEITEDCLASVTKGSSRGELILVLSPLVDSEYTLTSERCAELDVYKETEPDSPTVVILTQILDDHPKGISFERALRELRYIRRTSVHKLASILSTNDCFAQKPGTGVWRYNPKRADAGNDIARRTYLKSGF